MALTMPNQFGARWSLTRLAKCFALTNLVRGVRPLLCGVVIAAALLYGIHGAAAQQAEIELAPGDRVLVTVFGEADLSGEFDVDAVGRIALPLIGDVLVAGLSASQLESAIEERLREGDLNNPRGNLAVVNFRPVFILGEVSEPGRYPYEIGMTVLRAVALARGFTRRARTNGLVITRARAPKDGEQRARANDAVMPGDIVRVPERFF